MPAEESVHDETRVDQLREASEDRPAIVRTREFLLLGGGEVGPSRGNQRAGTVRQNNGQVQLAAALAPSKDLEYMPVKRMTRAYDRDPLRVAVEMVMMGSVSCLPSTA